MTGRKRCDVILQLIDEVLATTGAGGTEVSTHRRELPSTTDDDCHRAADLAGQHPDAGA